VADAEPALTRDFLHTGPQVRTSGQHAIASDATTVITLATADVASSRRDLGYGLHMIEREQHAPRRSDEDGSETPERVIAVGKLIHRFYRPSPERVAFDQATLWPVLHGWYRNDADAMSLLEEVNGTYVWVMAVALAKLMHEVHLAGGLEQEPD
jgi:hypothetical protein